MLIRIDKYLLFKNINLNKIYERIFNTKKNSERISNWGIR